MLRVLVFAAFLALPLAAQAQNHPTPVQQAMGAEIMELVQAKIALRAQVVQLQAELDGLKAAQPPDQKPTGH